MRWLMVISFLVLAFGCDESSTDKVEIPKLVGRVNDHAGKLSDAEKTKLEAKLEAHEKESTNQVVILVTKSLGDKTIEEYGIEVARAWKIGQSGKGGGPKDNGVVLIWAPKERKVRIEVGYGLEGKLTDLVAKEIADAMTEKFKNDKFFEGLDQATDDIIKVIRGEYKAGSKTGSTSTILGAKIDGRMIVFGIICLVVFVIAAAAGEEKPLVGGTVGAVGFGLAALICFPIWSVLLIAVIGFIAGCIARPIFEAMSEGSSSRSGGLFSSSSGSSGGGGGFSGGGGSFGGGGASSSY